MYIHYTENEKRKAYPRRLDFLRKRTPAAGDKRDLTLHVLLRLRLGVRGGGAGAAEVGKAATGGTRGDSVGAGAEGAFFWLVVVGVDGGWGG